MVTEDETFVIDPEFSFYGPMGFDVGKLVGNLLIAYCSQDGLADKDDHHQRQQYKRWILDTIKAFYEKFEELFVMQWQNHREQSAQQAETAFAPPMLTQSAFDRLSRSFMKNLFKDALGYAGACIIRRVIGLAHVEDFKSISCSKKRAQCEEKALAIARWLLVETHKFQTIADVIDFVVSKG
eukprot:TRINITY_DN5348_c0_g1_i2.p1 TRINITY_DN5348_c0_g1~~TRINITY_DN5348_c0_g1_i2.p1  ORF type:complete len:182 (-),score=34.48 TRINITY_DN5348_c0_g1_i2:28-573(-)